MDKVVTAVQYRDYVLVITEYGLVYRIDHDHNRNDIKIQVLATIPIK